MATETQDSGTADKKKSPAEKVVLGGRYRIFPEQPLDALSSPTASAFAAVDEREQDRTMFALVCNSELPVRGNLLTAQSAIKSPALLRLHEWGRVFWPAQDRHRIAMVYSRPAGPRVMASLENEIEPLSADDVADRLVAPFVAAIKELSLREATFRGIRPDNLFNEEAKGGGAFVLGEAGSSPPGYNQPVMFETIERGLAHPAGRGAGNTSDDLYALGVTALVLLLGKNPLDGVRDDDVLAAKTNSGSYGALVGKARFSTEIEELLCGLLVDDPKERWNLEQLELWLSGRRMRPRKPNAVRPVSRPFIFAEENYVDCRAIALAFQRNWPAAGGVIRDGSLETWLRRCLGDEAKGKMISAVGEAGRLKSARPGMAEDTMVAQACMILDPQGPIRLRKFRATIDGLGPMLAAAGKPEETQQFVDMFNQELPRFWFGVQDRQEGEHSDAEKGLQRLRYFLKQMGPGFGVERCLYELNPSLPCRSPMVERSCITRIQDLLPAMEESSRRGQAAKTPMDRHIAAFIASRFREDTEHLLAALGERADAGVTNLATLNILARLQEEFGPVELPGLTESMAQLMGPVVASFHSRKLRENLEGRIERLAKKGNLGELCRLLENDEERGRDDRAFAMAAAEYAAADAEISGLEARELHRVALAKRLGHRMAAMASVMAAAGTVTMLILNHAG